MNVYTGIVIVYPGRDEVSLTRDLYQLNAYLYKLKIDIEMLSMHRLCLGCLPISK